MDNPTFSSLGFPCCCSSAPISAVPCALSLQRGAGSGDQLPAPFACRNRPRGALAALVSTRDSVPTFPGFPCAFLGEEEEEEAQGQAVLGVGLGQLVLGQRRSSALQQEAQALREGRQGSQEEEAQEAQEVALG